jgi:hypothetical protein
MKNLAAAALVGLIVCASAPARAEDPKPDKPAATKRRGGDKTRFYDFDELLIDGQMRSPNAYFGSARQRMRWSRLLRLRKSFVSLLLSTDKFPILRFKTEK